MATYSEPRNRKAIAPRQTFRRFEALKSGGNTDTAQPNQEVLGTILERDWPKANFREADWLTSEGEFWNRQGSSRAGASENFREYERPHGNSGGKFLNYIVVNHSKIRIFATVYGKSAGNLSKQNIVVNHSNINRKHSRDRRSRQKTVARFEEHSREER